LTGWQINTCLWGNLCRYELCFGLVRCLCRWFWGLLRFGQVFFLFLMLPGKLWFFVIVDIKTTAFEYDTGTAGNEPAQFALALGTAGKGRVRDLLEFLERVLTLHAFIFVCRHYFRVWE
jgi:hypothetical protein